MSKTTTSVPSSSSIITALGSSVPPFTAHAISVSLPTWRDTVGYEEGEKRVVDLMVSGYPRFFIHLSIQKLAHICEQKFGTEGERSMLFPTKRIADQCRSFLHAHAPKSSSGKPIAVRLIHLLVCPEDNQNNTRLVDSDCGCDPVFPSSASASADLHIILFPADAFPIAKQFWQHTGMGISSRMAEYCLSMLPDVNAEKPQLSPHSPTGRYPVKSSNRHYSKSHLKRSSFSGSNIETSSKAAPITETNNIDSYLEERYGRNLPVTSAPAAKRAMRRRISGVLVRDNSDDCDGRPCAGESYAELGPSSRGVADVSEDDVFLYPSGMSAIWNAHNLALSVRPSAKSVCFGFPYTDTLKILQKWGPGALFLGHGLDSDIDDLEAILESELIMNPSSPPVLALFTEFPSNPLLRSADLPRLRALADKYDFLIVIDETIGNFVNVEVLPYADIVVSSLSKVFSGDSNVMGGSLVLNPRGRHYTALKVHMSNSYEDIYFAEDAVYMERNSRNFRRRIGVIDANAEAVCDFLRFHSAAGGASNPLIKEVFYPKYITRENFDKCRIQAREDSGKTGGFGGLFSLTFTSLLASQVFFDNLSCQKGPSLGTNFTLACPYTVLAHYTEMEWASQFGVEEGLVRVSVGLEDTGKLLALFQHALKAAEAATLLDN